ncbi:MAG: tetratricopeptide repeat protein [Legionellaceae bacterium]|nr:tetratricopeptide repeat protein [Legionellaceae bacterium]
MYEMIKKLSLILTCTLVILTTSAFSQTLSFAECSQKSDAYFEHGEPQKAISYLQSKIATGDFSEQEKIELTFKMVDYADEMKDGEQAIQLIKPFYMQLQKKHPHNGYAFILGKCLIRIYSKQKKIDSALTVAKENVTNAPIRYFQIIALADIGKLLSDLGENKKAIRYYHAGLKKIRKMNKNGRYNDLKGDIFYDIALCLDKDGQTQKATKALTKLMRWQKYHHLHYGKTATYLGLIAITSGNYDEAYLLFGQASQDYKDNNLQAYLKAENFRGVISQNYGHFDRAKQHYQTAFSVADKENILEWQIQTQNNLGSLAIRTHALEQAQIHLQRAFELNETYHSSEIQVSIYHNLALLADAKKQFSQAKQYYEKVVEMREHSPDKAEYAHALVHLAMNYQETKQFTKAEPLYLKAIHILDKVEPKGQKMVIAMTNLATFYVITKQYEKAEPLFKDAIDIALEKLGDKHPDLAYSYNNLGHLYSLQNKDKLALNYYKKALAISALGNNDAKTRLYRKNMLLSVINSKVRERRFHHAG